MAHLNTNSFPYITVRRVVIGREEVTVDAFITTHNEAGAPFWLSEEVFSDYINFYFILSPKILAGLSASDFVSPESRVDNILSRTFRDVSHRQTWFSNIEDFFSTKTVSLSEIKQFESDSFITTSPLDFNSGNLQDINFTTTIPIKPGDQRSLLTTELELFAFSHLNFAQLIEDFNLDSGQSSINELIQLGGNFKKETLLEISENGRVRVPETSTTLVYEDGTPYHGIYHYHDGDGPDGYTGYMEGPRSPMHPDSRRLREIRVNYRKVTANFIIDDLLFEPENPFNGSSDLISALDSNYNSPWSEERNYVDKVFSNSGFYRDSESNVVSSRRRSLQRTTADNLDIIFDPATNDQIRERYFNFLSERSDFSIVGNSIHYIEQLPESAVSHNLTFSIDFEKLIRSRSKYAFLIESLSSMFAQSPITNRQEAFEKVLQSFVIKDLKINRFRVSNEARSNNPIGTADYDRFDLDEQDVLILQASDETGRIVQTPGLEGSTLEERTTSPGSSIRKMILKDFDLAKNVNFGKYSYKITMTIEDRLKKYIMEFIKQMQTRIPNLLAFIAESNGSMVSQDTGDINPNYDFKAKKYSAQFALLSQINYDSSIKNLVSTFVQAQELLNTLTSEDSSILRSQLLKSIIPMESGTLESAERFLVLCREMLAIFRSVIATDGNKSVDSIAMDNPSDSYSNIGIKSPSNAVSSFINVDKKIPGIAEAFTVGDVLLSYDLQDLTSYADLVSNQEDRPTLVPPRATVSIGNGQVFNIAQAPSQFDTDRMSDIIRNNLNTMLRTPPEDSLIEIEDIANGALGPKNINLPGLQILNFDEDTFVCAPADINLDISIGGGFGNSGIGVTTERSLVLSSDEHSTPGTWLEAEIAWKEGSNDLMNSPAGIEVGFAVSETFGTGNSMDPFADNGAGLMLLDETTSNGGLIEVSSENIAMQPGDTVVLVANNTGAARTTNNVVEVTKTAALPGASSNSSGFSATSAAAAPSSTAISATATANMATTTAVTQNSATATQMGAFSSGGGLPGRY